MISEKNWMMVFISPCTCLSKFGSQIQLKKITPFSDKAATLQKCTFQDRQRSIPDRTSVLISDRLGTLSKTLLVHDFSASYLISFSLSFFTREMGF